MNREEMLKAACGLFLHEGIRNLSLNKIADRLGVTRHDLHASFGDKRELHRGARLRHRAGPAGGGTGPRSDGPDGLTRCPTNGPGDVRQSRKTPPDRSGGVSYTAALVYRTGNSVTRRVVQP